MVKATETEIQDAYADRQVAAKYIEQRFQSELHRLLHDRQVQFVNRLIARRQPHSILEIAPGPGRITREIEFPGQLTCLEFNRSMIDEGQAACSSDIRWVEGNAFDLPFERPFDLVYSFRFIRHFHLNDRQRLYEQIRRVTRQGSDLVFDAVNRRPSEPLRQASPAAYPIYDELYDADELIAELNAEGFEVVRLCPVQRSYNWQYRSQVVLGPRANWLNRTVVRALERASRGAGLEWIVHCKRR